LEASSALEVAHKASVDRKGRLKKEEVGTVMQGSLF